MIHEDITKNEFSVGAKNQQKKNWQASRKLNQGLTNYKIIIRCKKANYVLKQKHIFVAILDGGGDLIWNITHLQSRMHLTLTCPCTVGWTWFFSKGCAGWLKGWRHCRTKSCRLPGLGDNIHTLRLAFIASVTNSKWVKMKWLCFWSYFRAQRLIEHWQSFYVFMDEKRHFLMQLRRRKQYMVYLSICYS